MFLYVKNHDEPDEHKIFFKILTDHSIIYKKHQKMLFFAHPMLPQVASNEIFLEKVPHDISYLCVKYLTVADGG